MSNCLSPSIPGARAAKELLLRIARANARSIAATGELNPVEIADMIQVALGDASARMGLLLALAEVIANAVDGVPTDPACWTPLLYFTSSVRDANRSSFLPVPTKKF